MLRGELRQNLEREVGDFVLHRADGVFAYQLAVVVDDHDCGVTQVVRGADLLASTARQVYLYRCLGATAPLYLHLPLVLGAGGKKLSKRDGDDVVVTAANGAMLLWHGLAFLGQRPPEAIRVLPAPEILSWGIENFNPRSIPVVDRQAGFLQGLLS
jgi:glutamyl-Q tRNA(Asp) synthetase